MVMYLAARRIQADSLGLGRLHALAPDPFEFPWH